jgi:pyruvate,water dikinase
LASERATLPLAGGKGANLARLAQAGLPVPAEFTITTQAYHAFAAANGLTERIAAVLASGSLKTPEQCEDASARIRDLFGQGSVPADLAGQILDAYAALGRPAVAVRSSATAEDLPEMSFAGQQDTYLNVIGADALLEHRSSNPLRATEVAATVAKSPSGD